MLCGSALSLFPAAALHSSRAGCLLSSLHNLSAPAAWANSSAALLAGLISLCNYTCTAFLLPLPPPLRFMNGIAQPSSAETQLKEVQEKEKNFSEKKAIGNNVVLSSIHDDGTGKTAGWKQECMQLSEWGKAEEWASSKSLPGTEAAALIHTAHCFLSCSRPSETFTG